MKAGQQHEDQMLERVRGEQGEWLKKKGWGRWVKGSREARGRMCLLKGIDATPAAPLAATRAP